MTDTASREGIALRACEEAMFGSNTALRRLQLSAAINSARAGEQAEADRFGQGRSAF